MMLSVGARMGLGNALPIVHAGVRSFASGRACSGYSCHELGLVLCSCLQNRSSAPEQQSGELDGMRMKLQRMVSLSDELVKLDQKYPEGSSPSIGYACHELGLVLCSVEWFDDAYTCLMRANGVFEQVIKDAENQGKRPSAQLYKVLSSIKTDIARLLKQIGDQKASGHFESEASTCLHRAVEIFGMEGTTSGLESKVRSVYDRLIRFKD